MKAQKLKQCYKCECFEPYNYCICPLKASASDVLIDNVREAAKALIKVMKLCHIPASKADRAFVLISYYFLNYEEVWERVDAVPKKRLYKGDLFMDFIRKCNMTRMESQMAYSIIKRAFRAFYHGTGEGGVYNYMLSSKLQHSASCMWMHASKRTAEIFASYEGVFRSTQKDLECKIKELYKDLYDHVKATQTEGNFECVCEKCTKRLLRQGLRIAKVTTGMHTIADQYEAHYRDIVSEMYRQMEDQTEDGSKSLEKCSCPPLKMNKSDYKFQEEAKALQTGYSQGPFACHWAPISKEEYEADDAPPKLTLPEELPCPPCGDIESCDSECICSCEVCSCHNDEEMLECSGESIDTSFNSYVEAEEEEEVLLYETLSNSIETTDEEFSLKYSGCKDPKEIMRVLELQRVLPPEEKMDPTENSKTWLEKII